MRIIPLSDAPEPTLSPDLLWDGVMADLAPAGDGEAGNRGGLRATAALETAVLICLMTDARVSVDELRDGDVMRRTVDAVEVPRLAEDYAVAALQPLIDQGAAAKATATATADPARNRLELAITLTDRDGSTLVAPRYRVLWEGLGA